MTWINVKDKLPETYKEVIVYHHNNVVSGWLLPDGSWTNGDYIEAVTHWMPLPKPPGEAL